LVKYNELKKKGERITLIFRLENGNEHYTDILEVEKNFVTKTTGKDVSDLFLQNSLSL